MGASSNFDYFQCRKPCVIIWTEITGWFKSLINIFFFPFSIGSFSIIQWAFSVIYLISSANNRCWSKLLKIQELKIIFCLLLSENPFKFSIAIVFVKKCFLKKPRYFNSLPRQFSFAQIRKYCKILLTPPCF